MANTETDALELVREIPVQNFWGIFNRTYTLEDGFSLEVFQGNTYRGSIAPRDINIATKKHYESLKLRSSDTILRVNLGSHLIEVTCQLAMWDGLTRPYEGTLEIAICDPYQFIMRYRQGSDPIALARLAIINTVQRYAQHVSHDDLNEDTLHYEARNSLEKGTNKHYGLKVVSIHKSIAFMDARRAEIFTTIQQGEVDKTKINVDAGHTMLKAQHSADLQGFTDEKTRERDIPNKQHERNQRFLDAASRALEQRMLRDIENGVPLNVIARNYPQFAETLGIPVSNTLPPGSGQSRLNSGPQSLPPEAITGSFTVVTPNTAPSQTTTGTPQPFHNAQLGATILYMPLSNEQRQNWGVSNQVAFMVCALDTAGPAEQGHMMPGDMLIEIDDQQIQSADSMSSMLDTNQPGIPVPLRVLRGGQPLDLEIDVIHP